MGGTPLHLPRGLPFPITIQRLLSTPPNHVSKTQPLLSYSFNLPNLHDRESQVRVWECPIQGELLKWCVKVGDVLLNSK